MASRLLAARCARYRDEGHSKPLWLGLDGHPGRAKRPVQRVSETADGEHCGEQVSGKAFQDNSAARTRSIIAREAERGTAANEHTSVGCSCSQLRLLQSVSGAKVVRMMHITCHKFPTLVLAKLRVHKGRASDDSRQALVCPA